MNTSFDQLLKGARTAGVERKARGPVERRPQVSLMPAEVLSDEQGKRIRAGLGAVVFGVAALTAAVVLLAGQTAAEADTKAADATQRLSVASAQLGKFKDVQSLQEQITLLTAAQRVGSSTAIDWQKQLGLIETDLPAGLTVTAVSADSATPIADYPQGTTPLDEERVATVQITGTTSSIAELPAWLRQLKSLPAYVDATPTVSGGDSSADGAYDIQVVVHLSLKAYETPLKGGR